MDSDYTNTSGEIDLHLAINSPLIDKGLSGGGLNYGNNDYDFDERIQGEGIDIGADEVSISSAINDFKLPAEQLIFPNPATEVINFNEDISNEKIEEFKIFDVTGRLIHQGIFDQCVAISDYKAGIYHIQFVSQNKVHYTGRFIKQ
jgi:hypothetical protein